MLYAKHLDKEKQQRLAKEGLPANILSVIYDDKLKIITLELPYIPNDIDTIIARVKDVFKYVSDVQLIAYNTHRWVYGVIKDGKFVAVSKFASHRLGIKEPVVNKFKGVRLSEFNTIKDGEFVEVEGIVHSITTDKFGNTIIALTDGIEEVRAKLIRG